MIAQLLAIFHAFSQSPTSLEGMPLLVEAKALAQELGKPQLLVLDTRAAKDFDLGHIPDAQRVDMKTWQAQGKKPGGFRDAAGWAQLVGALGISHSTRVVVYGDQLPDTARAWWILKYLGLREARILDGGWKSWVKAGGPVTRDTHKVQVARFQPAFQADRLQEIEPLKETLRSGKARVVDARTTDEFTGKETRGPRGGHIPGSTHLEWKELLDPEGKFLKPGDLKALFAKKGLDPDETLVTC